MTDGAITPRQPPPETHVHLILHTNAELEEFYLEIPISVISALVVKPLKYLLYLGWAVKGHEGRLMYEKKGFVTDIETPELVKGGTYLYHTHAPAFIRAVDPEVIKLRSAYSCSSVRDENFRKILEERDEDCVFTGLPDAIGIHIIPHIRGDEWIQLIVKNRPSEKGSDDLKEVDDIRNGMLANSMVHSAHDFRRVVILKTPNPMMNPSDVKRETYNRLLNGLEFPQNGNRFTLQWIVPHHNPKYMFIDNVVPGNVDAAFVKDTEHLKPSGVLLHYNYGAAVVKHWGRNTSILTSRKDIPRPPKRIDPNYQGPGFKQNDRNVTINKLNASRQGGGNNADFQGGSRGGGVRDGGDWDEDDIVMLFWSNSPHAVQRRQEEKDQEADKISRWRSTISVD